MGSFVAIGNEGQTELRATNKESSGKIPAGSKFFIAEPINIAPNDYDLTKPCAHGCKDINSWKGHPMASSVNCRHGFPYKERISRIMEVLKPFTADET